ncbi:MAG TPA: GNAT family N-acetyltransferase [Candidatus Kapabacteria bacterium]|nr:GNAT family N-acetyltransferase [Candidatus Kapabacteria bacterium]
MFTIELIPAERLDTVLPLLQLLNPNLHEDVIAERLSDVRKTDYRCVGVFNDKKLIAISGLWILNKIYAGKHIEPDNVIVHPDYRSKGIGELLLNWIHQYATEQGCLTSELNSRISNDAGNKFWKKMGYEIVGYHFIKPLTTDIETTNSCLASSHS